MERAVADGRPAGCPMRTWLRLGCLSLGLGLLSVSPALADLGFPETVKFPPQILVDPDQALIAETLGEAEFESTGAGDPKVTRRGRHFARWYKYKPAAGEPAPGYDNGTEERIWNAVERALKPAGWQVVYLAENKDSAVLRRPREGGESWLRMKMDGPQAAVHFEMIDSGGAVSNPVVHRAPGAKPERIGDGQPIPYLMPYPGSTLVGGGRGDGPLDVTLAFPDDKEPPVAGRAVLTRNYKGPSSLSRLQFMRDNREALVKAGWTVLFPRDPDSDAAAIIARFSQGERDVWAGLYYEYGANISYTVTDDGTEDWGAVLERDCRLPLYGVRFAFNKATISPESDVILSRAASALKARAGFPVEVHGHTDNVGGDDYNRTLSQARAAAVQAWLGGHGVAASRLSAKGFGKTQPVADNGTDFGRAQNRRVELVKAGCRKP